MTDYDDSEYDNNADHDDWQQLLMMMTLLVMIIMMTILMPMTVMMTVMMTMEGHKGQGLKFPPTTKAAMIGLNYIISVFILLPWTMQSLNWWVGWAVHMKGPLVQWGPYGPMDMTTTSVETWTHIHAVKPALNCCVTHIINNWISQSLPQSLNKWLIV